MEVISKHHGFGETVQISVISTRIAESEINIVEQKMCLNSRA